MASASLDAVIGQEQCVARLRAFAELYQDYKTAMGHVLLLGPEGMGKSTILLAFAEEYGLPCRDSKQLREGGGPVAVLTNVRDRDALLVERLDDLETSIAGLLLSALQKNQLQIVIGQGRSARDHILLVARFTCLATAETRSGVHSSLLAEFPLVLALSPYSPNELARIGTRIASQMGVAISDSGIWKVAQRLGTPAELSRILRMIKKTINRESISGGDVCRVLDAMCLAGPSLCPDGRASADFSALTGVEFEKVIAEALRQMGLEVQTTKATGDGGIDIIAVLNQPFVGGRFLIQCKRYAEDAVIGAPTVREFYGAFKADRTAHKAILVTTARFSPQAQQFAQENGVELIDGARLRELIGGSGAVPAD